MPINLIADRWLPCRRASGARVWLAPGEITDGFAVDPVVALMFPRPDWNAAVIELMIGLLSVALPPASDKAWAELWIKPPSPDELRPKLAPLAFAFNLGGDGARAFQDCDPLADAGTNGVAALLIDAPGENAIKENKDLFVKRALIDALCPAYAAAALVTLQTYAPSGGQGYRTSMRGGGPLSLLLAPIRRHRVGPVSTLWDRVWSSVVATAEDEPFQVENGAVRDAHLIFPWLAATRTSRNDRGTSPGDDAAPLQQFFGLPRRIRLTFTLAANGVCSLGGPPSDQLCRTYQTTNYGVKYEGWFHTLSPYYRKPPNEWFCYHPQPGLSTYADWLGWWGFDDGNRPAANVRDWPKRLISLGRAGGIAGDETRHRGIIACGFDMDNMKARAWLEERIPYYEPPADADPNWSTNFQTTVRMLVDGAKQAAGDLAYAIRFAQYAKRQIDGSLKLNKSAPRGGDDAIAEQQFWRATEPAFLKNLDDIHPRENVTDATFTVRESFRRILRSEASHLFDAAAGMDHLADQDARRVVEAKRMLLASLSPTGRVAQKLQIVTGKQKDGKGNARGGKQ